jgi:hypothetical protein
LCPTSSGTTWPFGLMSWLAVSVLEDRGVVVGVGGGEAGATCALSGQQTN